MAGKRGVAGERIDGVSTRLRAASLRMLGKLEMAGRFSLFPRRGKPLRFGRFKPSEARTGGLLRTVGALPGRALSIRGVWTRGISIRGVLARGTLERTLGPLERVALPKLADGRRTLLPPLRIEGGALRTEGVTLGRLPRLRRLLLPPLRIEGMLRLKPPLLRIALPELRDMPPLLRMALPALRDIPPLERLALAPPPRWLPPLLLRLRP